MLNFISIGWSLLKAIRLKAKQKVSNSDYPPSLDKNDSIVESKNN